MSNLSQEDKSTIKALYFKHGISASEIVQKYPEKEWSLGAVNLFLTRINSARLGKLTRKYVKQVMEDTESEKFDLYPPKVSRISDNEKKENEQEQYKVDRMRTLSEESSFTVDEQFLLPVVELKELDEETATGQRSTQEPVFPCDTCQLAFTCRINYLRHMKYKHHMLGDISKVEEDDNEFSRLGMIYICLQCKRTFRNSNSLRKHQITHTTGKPFKCDLCSFQSKRKENLRAHKRKHEDLEDNL